MNPESPAPTHCLFCGEPLEPEPSFYPFCCEECKNLDFSSEVLQWEKERLEIERNGSDDHQNR